MFNHKAQKAALTRAVKSKDKDKLIAACHKAVREWNAVGYWPDDWSRWQRALYDANVFAALEDLGGSHDNA
jgi:hypothetical protein